MALLGSDNGAVQAAIDQCIALLPDQSLRIIRIRGAQGSPLTLSRIIRELGAGEHTGAPADDDELIVRLLAKPGGNGGRVVLVIEQAERLSARTLAFLQVISTVFGARSPGIQLLFAGHPSFEQLISTDELAGIRDRLETIVHVASTPATAVPRRLAQQSSRGADARGKAPARPFFVRRKKALAALLAVIVIAAGASLATVWRTAMEPAIDDTGADPSLGGRSAQPSPQPPSAQPSPALPPQAVTPVPDPGPATAASPERRRPLPSGEQLARLREEFDRFLAQTEWGSKRQSESERQRLFNEFLQWSYGATASNAEPPPPLAALPSLSRTRVMFYFQKGSANGEGVARRFATTLRPSVATARTRSVAEVPKTFELRYFAPEDEAAAEALARMLQTPEITWLVRIAPDTKPMPAPHTIEFWIPLR